MDEASEVAAVQCRDVLRAYVRDSATLLALRGVDLELRPGSVTALAGPSGSGKSTLLRILAGIDAPTAGDVLINGQRLTELSGKRRARFIRRQIAYVYQHPIDNVVDTLTVDENILMSAHLRQVGNSDPARLRAEMPLLADLGRVAASDLSAGQQQCLAFVMAMVGDPALIIADEPTAELDEDEAAIVLDVLRAASARGVASLFATHDQLILGTVDDIIRLRAGRIVSTARRSGETLVPIDAGGWLPLPPDHGDHFPDRSATVDWHRDHYEVRPTWRR